MPNALRWLVQSHAGQHESLAELLDTLAMPAACHAYACESLRKGLFIWFRAQYDSGVRGRVLVSAQICPVVPKLIARAGFDVGFVDIDSMWPSPTSDQYAEALDDSVIAVVVSPLYGHLPPDWTPLLMRLGSRALVLDLAQGFGLGDMLIPLVNRANAIGFSFGFGKGPDTGGGLLMSSQALPVADLRGAGPALCLKPALQASLLNALADFNMYGALIRGVPDIADNALAPFHQGTRFLASPAFYGLWNQRLKIHLKEITLARERAASLASKIPIAEAVLCPEIYFSDSSSHLRQIIRLRDLSRRDYVVKALRTEGIDCAAAGELLPNEYRSGVFGDFPQARSFRADAIRLPFTGRLADAQFRKLEDTMESTFVRYLS